MADQGVNVKITVDARQGVAAVGEQARAFGQLSVQAGQAQQSIKALSVAFAAGQAAFVALGAALSGVFVGLPQAAIAAERLNRAFTTLTGSAAAAAQEQRFIAQEAQRLGIALGDAQDAYLKLAAAARGTALEGEQARRIFSAVAGAASTLGLSSSETAGALLAISQMMSKGTVQAEELRGQLGERIPGAFQIAARAMGITTSKLSEMLDQGQVLADDFLPKFADQLAREIPGAGDTMAAAMQRVGNASVQAMQLFAGSLATAIDQAFGLKNASQSLRSDSGIVEFARVSAKAVAALIDVVRELVLFVPNVLKTVGGSIAAVARDIKFAFDLAAAVVTDGLGEKGRAAMKRALDERNAFIAAYNDDMARRWFPKQLTERVDEFFAKLARDQSAGASRAAALFDAELTKEQQKTIDAIKSKEEKLAAEYKAHATNLYSALTSGAISIDEYNKQRAKLDAWMREQQGKLGKQGAATRLPGLAAVFDAELARLKDGLKTAESVIEASYKGRLITEDQYWQAKAATQRRALDLEEQELRGKLAAQQDLIARLSGVKPKDANQQAEVADRLREANNKAAELQAQLDALDGRRVAVDLSIQLDRARLDKELADIKAKLAQEFAQATGTETPEMRLAAIRREYDDLLARFGDDPALRELVDKLVPVKAAQANLAALEAKWREAIERMHQAQDNANVLQQSGLMTPAQSQSRIEAAAREAKSALEALLPDLEAAMRTLFPPEEVARRMENLRAEIVKTQPVADSLMTKIAGQMQDAFSTAFGDIVTGTKKVSDAFRSMAQSILQSLARIFAQRAAEQIFNWMFPSFGGVKKNAQGGVYSSASLAQYANRIVSAPTLFAFAAGGIPRLGLMGEAGPEAIMPLKRGPDGRLGVEAHGAGNVVVNVSVDASGSKVEGDAGIARQLGDMIAGAVRGILVQEKRPGGLLAGA